MLLEPCMGIVDSILFNASTTSSFSASALGMDVEIASNTGPSEYFNKSARVDLLTLDYTLPGRFMIGVARSSDYLSDTTSDATSPSETGSSRFCNCLFRKIRLNTEKTSFIFSKSEAIWCPGNMCVSLGFVIPKPFYGSASWFAQCQKLVTL